VRSPTITPEAKNTLATGAIVHAKATIAKATSGERFHVRIAITTAAITIAIPATTPSDGCCTTSIERGM